jgi:hypothetical protein
MNLSFLPGDLHLTQNAEGFFTITAAGKQILLTKSESYAIHKFHTLRIELEHRFPARELTAETKAELLLSEVAESVLREPRMRQPKTRIATGVLFEVEAALRSYCDAVLESDLSEYSHDNYIRGADNFVRWLKGEFDPGSRVAPYKGRKKDSVSSVSVETPNPDDRRKTP